MIQKLGRSFAAACSSTRVFIKQFRDEQSYQRFLSEDGQVLVQE